MPKEDFFKEIEKFYLEHKGFGSQISAKEREIIQSWFKKNIPVKLIKTLIIDELNRLPLTKRKKFSLINVEKRISEYKKLSKVEKNQNSPLKKWIDFVKAHKLPEYLLKTDEEDVDFAIQNNIINYIWDNIKNNEKEEIIKKAKNILKSNINLKQEEYKKALKSQIRKEIKKRYNIPD